MHSFILVKSFDIFVINEFYVSTLQDGDNFACWENYSVFTVSTFQYIILAYVFSKSKPYRKWVITNVPFVTSLLVLTAATLWLAIEPSP